MSKRQYEQEGDDRPPKRPRPDFNYQKAAVEDIQFARQLQQLLTFRQDGIQQLRNGIASFKAFLESILYHRDEESRARQLSILREYLETQKPADPNDPEKPFLGQLWQGWSFANQNNNDYLASSIAAVFALILRTLSSLLDFQDLGTLLCRTVLQHQHLRLIKRGLNAPKHKEFVISPCVRLLTEVTSFDGGDLAHEVQKRKEETLDISTLRRNLGLVKTDIPEDEAHRKPSVRTLTVRYVLAHLKYLHEGAKVGLLQSRPLCIALFSYLADDPADLVNEILSVTEQNVLKDRDLQSHRSAKQTLLTSHNLERVTEVATRSREDHPSAERAFAWLKAVSTTPSYGVLWPSGWYPPGTTRQERQKGRPEDAIDLGLDSLEFYDQTDRPQVRNSILLAWIQTLRPHSDPKERELVLTCFESAPELVAAYFAEKNMQLEPKLSNTWIGYASFMFEVIRLTSPTNLGNVKDESDEKDDGYAELPPQTAIVLESLIPRPLTQKVLTRCLNQSSELITFFAVRILVLAFQKLANVQKDLRKVADMPGPRQSLWKECSERLSTRFMERAPAMKDVISTFRKIPDDDDHALQREAVSRLLRLYYELTPIGALAESFDVSAVLTAALVRDDEASSVSEAGGLRQLELQHLLAVAKHSPGMRWFSKQGALKFSPMVSLLKLHLRDVQNREIRTLLWDVLSLHDLLATEAELDALMGGLIELDDAGKEVWGFIDDCLTRASKQPVKYVDQLEAASLQPSADSTAILEPDAYHYLALPGLLAAAVAEQAPFAAKKPVVVRWILVFLNVLSEQTKKALALKDRLLQVPEYKQQATDIAFDSKGLLGKARLPEIEIASPSQLKAQVAPTLPFTAPRSESNNHPELVRWSQKDLSVAVEDGDVDALILCLCSAHSDVRRQAHAQLRTLLFTIPNSGLEDKDPIRMVVGELIETFEKQCTADDKPLPYLTGTFASQALHVLQEPTHYIYPKLNRYLIKSPEWRISRMPSYWLQNTVHSRPEEDDAYWKEVQWVLDWLVDGLRTQSDLDILRRSDVFEQVTALYCSPAAAGKAKKSTREKVVELLYRATCVEGGSGTMITRAGVLAWLEMVERGGDDSAGLMKRRVLESCDLERVHGWSGVKMDVMVFFSPLAPFPGPWLAAATYGYEFYYDIWPHTFRYMWKIKDLHDKYGPIVRINPTHLHILDPSFYEEIHPSDTRRKRDRDRWFNNTERDVLGEGGLTQTIGHDLHRTRRSAIAPLFSKKNIYELQPLVKKKVDKLVYRFSQACKGGDVINLVDAMSALTMDVISSYCFGKDMRQLDKPEYAAQVVWEMIAGSKIAGPARHLPWLFDFLLDLPPWFLRLLQPQYPEEDPGQMLRDRMQYILDHPDEPSEDGNITIVHTIKDSNLPPPERTASRLAIEAATFLGAGTETTGRVLAVTAYYLIANIDLLARLREELKIVMPTPDTEVALSDLEKLPFLTAVLHEGLRLANGVSGRMPRVAPVETLIFHAREKDSQKETVWEIPPGTAVSSSIYLLHHDEDIFPDSYSFKPERWIDNMPLRQHLYAFAKGNRGCLGSNLAWSELYQTIAILFRRFDLSLHDTIESRDIEIVRDFSIAGMDPSSKGIRIKVVEELTS
ncbi:hypothetical protein LTR08_005383 [Meristemomyces frigidus]|nr:hypothetical protein LTR08_005383 [Meristemomyces frigidus]